MSHTFHPGDVVRMKGPISQPLMTVEHMDESDDTIRCLWFDKNDTLCYHDFKSGALDLITSVE